MSGPNPRKFADKIALLRMKEREMGESFETILREVGETRRTNVTLTSSAPQGLSRWKYMHSSMPNLQSAVVQTRPVSTEVTAAERMPVAVGQGAQRLAVPYHHPLPHQEGQQLSFLAPTRKISAPAVGDSSMYRLSATHAWQSARSHSLELPKTASNPDLMMSSAVAPTGQYIGGGIAEPLQEEILDGSKAVFGQPTDPSVSDSSSSILAELLDLKPSSDRSLLQSKTLSLPNLSDAVSAGRSAYDSALPNREAGPLYADVSGGVQQACRHIDPVGFDQRHTGGGAMKARRNVGLLHVPGGRDRSKPYSAVSSSVPNLKEALQHSSPQQRIQQPQTQPISSLATSPPSLGGSALPADLSQAALNASFTPSFLGGPLSERPPDDAVGVGAFKPGASTSSQYSALFGPRMVSLDSDPSTTFQVPPGLDNSMHLRQLMAGLQLQQNAPVSSGGYPSPPLNNSSLINPQYDVSSVSEGLLPSSGALQRVGSHSSLSSSQTNISAPAAANSAYASPSTPRSNVTFPTSNGSSGPSAMQQANLIMELNSLQYLPQYTDATSDLSFLASQDLPLTGNL